MKINKIIGTLIVIIIITIIMLLVAICILKYNNVDKKEEKETSNVNDEDDVFDLEEGGAEYSSDILNNYEFSVKDMEENFKAKIENQSDYFTLKLKEYVYLNGLVEANEAKYIKFSQISDDVLIAEFLLNDSNKTSIYANINTKNKTYIFSDNY